ncbi:MAG: hypothetical protein LIP09_08320 [Bacteroidales bacterium]|nr:hypothetical protein [Bacteroidales bacterium]
MTFHQPDIKSLYGAYRLVPSIVIFFLVIFASCADRSRYQSELDGAEALMEEHPDSALALIDGIDEKQLGGSQERARYALLKSMALDKNYVDTTDFAVLQPAIDHYLHHGSPDQKLRTLFYQGRIFQNRGDNAAAMNCYLQARDLGHITDTLTLARLLTWQGLIQKSIYDFEGYKNCFLKAARLFDQLSQPKRALDCHLSGLNAAILLNDKAAADSLVNICENTIYKKGYSREKFNDYLLSYYEEFGDKFQIEKRLKSFSTDSFSPGKLLSMANANLSLGNALQTKSLLESVPLELLDDDELIRYYAVKVMALQNLEEYKDALHAYQIFTHKMDSIHIKEFDEKTRFSEEKYNYELEAQRNSKVQSNLTLGIISGGLVLTLIIALLWATLNNQKVRTENLQLNLTNLNQEYENLKSLLKKKPELPQEVTDVVKERFEMLNSFLVSGIAVNHPSSKSYKTWVKDLTSDKTRFMKNNRLAIHGSNPKFISYLKAKGLTDDELDFICLYLIGLNGKEVAIFLGKPNQMNGMITSIRKKLELSIHDTNLGKFIQNLFKNTPEIQ